MPKRSRNRERANVAARLSLYDANRSHPRNFLGQARAVYDFDHKVDVLVSRRLLLGQTLQV